MKQYLKYVIIVLAILGLGYTAPIAFTYFNCGTMDGYYDSGGRCGCGILIWEIRNEKIYEISLSHKTRDLMYTLKKTGDFWKLMWKDDCQVEIKYDGRNIVDANPTDKISWTISRIYNLWPIWLTKIENK
ncbi:hypothetical protein ACFLS1_11970 [Verrucomicrobiota bacterium]